MLMLSSEGSKIFSESTVIGFIHIMENVDVNGYFKSKKARYCQGQKKQNNITKVKQKEQFRFQSVPQLQKWILIKIK